MEASPGKRKPFTIFGVSPTFDTEADPLQVRRRRKLSISLCKAEERPVYGKVAWALQLMEIVSTLSQGT